MTTTAGLAGQQQACSARLSEARQSTSQLSSAALLPANQPARYRRCAGTALPWLKPGASSGRAAVPKLPAGEGLKTRKAEGSLTCDYVARFATPAGGMPLQAQRRNPQTA